MMSSLRQSLGVAAGAAFLLMATGALTSEAQEPARSKAVAPKIAKKARAAVVEEEDEAPAPKVAAKKKSDPHRRLYPYFAQLGLSDEQRESIYNIRSKHAAKIDALEKQLDDARSQAMGEAERILTPAQRKMLDDRRKAALAAAAAKAADEKGETDEPKPKPAQAKKKRTRSID